MALEKFRAFMDLGRVQGVSVTAAVAILGSLTAAQGPHPFDIFWLVTIETCKTFPDAEVISKF